MNQAIHMDEWAVRFRSLQFNQFTRNNFIRMIVLDLSKACKTLKTGNNRWFHRLKIEKPSSSLTLAQAKLRLFLKL